MNNEKREQQMMTAAEQKAALSGDNLLAVVQQDWSQVRIQAAIAAMQTVDDHVSTVDELAERCVRYADALVAELRKGGEE